MESDDLVTIGSIGTLGTPTTGVRYIASGDILTLARTTMVPGLLYNISTSVTGVPHSNIWRATVHAVDNGNFDLHLWDTSSVRFVNGYNTSFSPAAWQGWRRVDSGGAFPSGQSISLSIPANTGFVTAPDNGYITFSAAPGGGETLAQLLQGNNRMSTTSTNYYSTAMLPVTKDAQVRVDYLNANISGSALYFVKSIGSV